MALTAAVLTCLSFALASESLIAILARAFYASRDTLTPVAAAVVAGVINLSQAIAHTRPLGPRPGPTTTPTSRAPAWGSADPA